MLRLLASLAALTCLATGCFTLTQRKEDTLITSAREFNDNLRWGRYQQVVEYLPAEERRLMLERVADVGEDLAFADSEVTSIDFSKGSDKAAVIVNLTWYSQRNPIMKRTVVHQQWEYTARGWMLTHQRRARGDRFPLVPEPVAPPGSQQSTVDSRQPGEGSPAASADSGAP